VDGQPEYKEKTMDGALETKQSREGAIQSRRLAGSIRRAVLLGTAVLLLVPLLLALGTVVALQAKYDGLIVDGVTIGDVQVGGLTSETALAKLRARYGGILTRPLVLRAAESEWTAYPQEVGFSLSLDAAVQAAYGVGRTGGILQRISAQVTALRAGYTMDEPALQVDRRSLEAFLAARAGEFDREVKDAGLLVEDGFTVRLTPSTAGRRIDLAAAPAVLEQAIIAGADAADLPVVVTQPARVEADLEETRRQLTTIYSGPVALEFQGKRWTINREQIAALVSIEGRDGKQAPVISLDDAPLRQMVDRIAEEVDQPRRNGRLAWNGGDLQVILPGQDGLMVDRATALSALVEAISGDRRTAALPVATDRAVGGSIDLSSLGIRELVESASTSFAGSVSAKAHNINLAASRLNGLVLAPGEIFSFNRELGPTTLSSGFQVGFGIEVKDGEMQTVPSVAGGICQVSTTLLHAVFWAGYQIEERYPHMYWIASYGVPPKGMLGLDATVDDPYLDFQFRNNTDSYLLIQSRVERDSVQFSLYGTKPDWRVEVEGPIIASVTRADTAVVRQEDPTMPEGRELWVERATDGQDVTIIRRVIQGSDVRMLRLRSDYRPSRNVILVGTLKPEPVAGEEPPQEGTQEDGGQGTTPPDEELEASQEENSTPEESPESELGPEDEGEAEFSAL
jgi:vancomycin resistance protein YoaR